jgi:hypothetical protein
MAARSRHTFLASLAVALLAFCALAPANAHAQNWVSLLKNSPAEFFDDEDVKLFLTAARGALDGVDDNQVRGWRNPRSGHHGDATVLRRFDSKGRPCKELRVRNEAQGRKSDERFDLCSIEGRWRLLGKSQL